MNEGHDDATQVGGNNSAEQFQPEPQTPQANGQQLNESQPSPSQPGAPQGIFSSGELAVNSENLEQIKPELSDENKSRIASAFAQTDATQKRDQLSEQMADQDAVSGTVLPAGAANGFGNSGAGGRGFGGANNATTSTATGDIRIPGAKKKSKAPLLILAMLVVLGVVGGVAWLVLRNNDVAKETEATAVGVINTDIIFDQTAPIPAVFGNSYGYISPDDGTQVIGSRFLNAERFYGEYAVVKTGTDGIASNTLVINRTGEVIFDLSGDATATYYDIENNLWMIDGDAYNIDMQKLSPANTKGQYIGNGYLLVTSEVEGSTTPAAQEDTENDDAEENSGESGSSSGSDDEQNQSSAVLGSIYNLDNKKIYDCEAYCSAFTLKVDNKVYGIVRIWGDSSRVINLSNGEVIYQTTQGTIYLQEDVLIERNGNNDTFLKIQNNQVVKTAQPEATTVTVSNSNEYVIETCDGANKYTIKSIDGRVVSNCDIDNYYELPTNLYLAYRNKFKKSPILVVKNNELQLLNMNDAQVIRTYRGQDVMTFEDSPFLYMQNLPNNESVICNVFNEGDDACRSLGNESQTVEGYSNYFTASSGATEHIYNAELKEIR